MDAKKAVAMIAIKGDAKELEKALRESKSKLRAFGSAVGKTFSGLGSGAYKGLGKIIGGGKGALDKLSSGLGVPLVGGIMDAAGSLRDFERNLVRFQITAGKSNPQMERMREAITDVSKATAISNEDILEGVQTYVDLTGDVQGAESAMSSFARIAQASGSKVSDIATATAALRESMKLDPHDIEAVFSGLISQGKAGAVNLKDFAGELSRLAPQFARFGGESGQKGIADLGAALQVTRKGFGSAEQSAVGLQNMMTALSLNAAKFEAVGVKVFNKDPKTGVKTFRSFVDVVDSIGKSSLVKDPTALTKAFGSSEAERTFNILSKNRDELEKMYAAGMDAGTVQRDLDTYMQSSAGKLDTVMNNLKVAVTEAFTPERIAAFVEMIEEVGKAIGAVIGGLTEIKDKLTGKTDRMANPFLPKAAADFDMMDMAQVGAAGQMGEGSGAADALVALSNPRNYQAAQAKLPGPAGDFARMQEAQAKAYDQAMGSISGGGRSTDITSTWGNREGSDYRSRDEKIRTAVSAAYSGSSVGEMKAGQTWLKEEGVSKDRIAEILEQQKTQGDALASVIGNTIRDAMRSIPVTVKMDSSAVAKSVESAPSVRTPR